MDRLLIAAAIVVVAVVVALLARRRRPDAPAQVSRSVPSQLDRSDFVEPDAAWLVAVFTSATCDTCAEVVRAARTLAAPPDVVVADVEYRTRRDLHDRYRVEAVPMVVIADADGVVRAGRFGPVSATELAAALVAARRPDGHPGPTGRGESQI